MTSVAPKAFRTSRISTDAITPLSIGGFLPVSAALMRAVLVFDLRLRASSLGMPARPALRNQATKDQAKALPAPIAPFAKQQVTEERQTRDQQARLPPHRSDD